MYCIYKATNKITGGIYIGKTNNFKKRKREHLTDTRSDHIFQRALRKYGDENFSWEIIESNIPTNEKANERESYWIEKFNSFFRSDGSVGYNMTRGGDGGTCWNIRMVASYFPNGKLDRAFNSVTEASDFYGASGPSSVSRVCKDQTKTCCGMRFVYVDGEPLESIDIPVVKNPRCKPLMQYSVSGELIREYSSVSEAENLGFRRTGIIGCAKGRYKTSEGYVWVYKGDERRIRFADPQKPYNDVRVLGFNQDGSLFGEFVSCADAARKIGIGTNKGIHKALKSKTHKAYGFFWYRSDDVNMPIPR